MGFVQVENWVYLHQTWEFCKARSALYDYPDK